MMIIQSVLLSSYGFRNDCLIDAWTMNDWITFFKEKKHLCFHVCNFLSSKCAARNIIIRVSIELLWAAHFLFCSIFVNILTWSYIVFHLIIFFKVPLNLFFNSLCSNCPLCNCSSKSFIKLNCWLLTLFFTKSAKNQVAGATKKCPSLWSQWRHKKTPAPGGNPFGSTIIFALPIFCFFSWIIVFDIFWGQIIWFNDDDSWAFFG